MSEYTQALAELAALPRRLDEQIARSKREVAAERERREQEIEAAAREHEQVVSQLEAVLVRAHGEGVDFQVAAADPPRDAASSADPIDYARQLVGRLEEALDHFRYTRDALAAEEAKLSEEERQRLAEGRRRRELEELRRAEQWERARQGTIGLGLALVVALTAGLASGLAGSPAILALPLLAAAAGLLLAKATVSTLPALAVRRATGTQPSLPSAPARESRLAAAGYAAAMLASCGLGQAATGLLVGGLGVGLGGLGLASAGFAATALIWVSLPRAE